MVWEKKLKNVKILFLNSFCVAENVRSKAENASHSTEVRNSVRSSDISFFGQFGVILVSFLSYAKFCVLITLLLNFVQRKASKEGMQKIHSESQRMVRESTVCLPYHKVGIKILLGHKLVKLILPFFLKPKQRSLMDFLNRKRVTPSSEDRIKPRPRDLGAIV